MQNAAGENVELYIPRKCSWTHRLIASKDHGAVQINVGISDKTGRLTDRSHTFAIAGPVRHKGESDLALTELITQADAKLA